MIARGYCVAPGVYRLAQVAGNADGLAPIHVAFTLYRLFYMLGYELRRPRLNKDLPFAGYLSRLQFLDHDLVRGKGGQVHL